MFVRKPAVPFLLLICLLLPWDCSLEVQESFSSISSTTNSGQDIREKNDPEKGAVTNTVIGNNFNESIESLLESHEGSPGSSASEEVPAVSTKQPLPLATQPEQEEFVNVLSESASTIVSPPTSTTQPPATTTAPTTHKETTVPPTTLPPKTSPPTVPPSTTAAPVVTKKPTVPDSPPTTNIPMQLTTSGAVNNTTTSQEVPPIQPSVPPKEVEPAISISIFLIFVLLSVCSVLVHLMIKYKLKFLPESIAFVIIGFIVGIFYNTLIPQITGKDLSFHERFSPDSFFLLLLPPIIFESGYSLHKGNFFQNLGSIILFAVVGTAVSTFIVGGGLVGLSKLGVIYELSLVQGFSFGALISAVDPVATLAIFHALDVNPTLNMLVFGESVLNDAVSIVMTK